MVRHIVPTLLKRCYWVLPCLQLGTAAAAAAVSLCRTTLLLLTRQLCHSCGHS
jgi:hypothetical protein